MNKKYHEAAIVLVPFAAIALPAVALAQSGGSGPGVFNIPCNGPDCDFADFIQLFKNVMDYLVYISFPIAALMFAYAGWLFISSVDNPGQRSTARGVMWKVGIGFAVILAAWLLVYTLTSALLKPGFSPIG